MHASVFTSAMSEHGCVGMGGGGRRKIESGGERERERESEREID